MSIVDNNLYMSDAQAVTATASSTKSLDMATALRNVGGGEPIELVVQVATTVAASGGASNVTFSLDDSADNSSFAVVVQSPAIPKATLVAGYEALRIRLPVGLRRYIQVTYTVDTNNLTAGAFNAYLVLDRQDNVSRPSGFSVI
ncbi:Bbp16 family capsid cement protein [Reyranella sp.]|uniref:Bbp16 family capsid cement protein n=1 Tax=Reyranella sp. TaxID=1929291 RepID=UPI003D0E6D00